MNILEIMSAERLWGPFFKGESWDAWRVTLKAIDALPMTKAEERFFCEKLSGGRVPPKKPCQEIFLLFGRRSGKSKVASVKALHSAFFQGHRLDPGESGQVSVTSWSRSHARVILRYMRAMTEPPLIRGEVDEILAEELRLANGLTVNVETCRLTASRGWSTICAVLEESSFWRSEGLNKDLEIYRAILPSTATTDGSVISISTPYAATGLNFEAWKESYGVNDPDRLVLQAPSILMNPTLNASWVAKQIDRDPEAGRSEWEAEFRRDISNFLAIEDLEASVEKGCIRRSPQTDFLHKYVAFADVSGGRGDSSVLAIAHEDFDDRLWLDLIFEKAGKHSPIDFCNEAAALMNEYECSTVIGDRYAAGFAVDAWNAAGVSFKASEFDRSTIYREFLPLLLSGRVHLLDSEKMLRQFSSLERRTSSGGKDRIDHGIGGKDDLANATSGAITSAARARRGIRDLIWL